MQRTNERAIKMHKAKKTRARSRPVPFSSFRVSIVHVPVSRTEFQYRHSFFLLVFCLHTFRYTVENLLHFYRFFASSSQFSSNDRKVHGKKGRENKLLAKHGTLSLRTFFGRLFKLPGAKTKENESLSLWISVVLEWSHILTRCALAISFFVTTLARLRV